MTNLNIPIQEYDLMLALNACTNAVSSALQKFLQKSPYERILLYGASNTGLAIRERIGKERFAGFVDTKSLAGIEADAGDCIIITTSPVHVPEVEKSLKNSRISHLPIIRLFAENELNIRLIVETQPRSGTDYTMDNLTRSLGLGYATVFNFDGGTRTADGLIRYIPKKCNGYAIKTHFTNTLHYPQYRYCQTIFLLGYFPDTYYRWARMLAKVPVNQKNNYYLSSDAPEWARVKGYIPLHLQWLEFIRDKTFIRYEDYINDFKGIMDTFERLLGVRPDSWEKARKISSRLYWSKDPERIMDEEVRSTLDLAFAEPIQHFYPEIAGR